MTSSAADTQAAPAARSQRRWTGRGRTLRRLARQPVTVAAGVVLLIIFGIGAFVPEYAPSVSATINLAPRWHNHAPMLHGGWHLLGTDGIGRDIFVWLLWALHTSEQSAVYGTLLATLIGVVLGGIAGFRGGWPDAILMRIGDTFGFLPALMLLLIAYVYFEPITVFKATIILSCYLWIPVARVVRAEFATLREREFIEAARSLGASDRRIFLRHLLPNAGSTIIVAATALLGQVIMLEATIEFFGLGVPAQLSPTLGNLIGDGQRGVLYLGWGWWTWALPAILLVVVLACANLFGDGLADALRPRGRN